MKIQMTLETAYTETKMPTAGRLVGYESDGWRISSAVAGREWAAVDVLVTRRDWTPDTAVMFITLELEAALCPDGLECTRADVDGKPLELA